MPILGRMVQIVIITIWMFNFFAPPLPVRGQLYRHYKGSIVIVWNLFIADNDQPIGEVCLFGRLLNVTDRIDRGERVVIYYHPDRRNEYYARPLRVFNDRVVDGWGFKRRFESIGAEAALSTLYLMSCSTSEIKDRDLN